MEGFVLIFVKIIILNYKMSFIVMIVIVKINIDICLILMEINYVAEYHANCT